MEARMRRLTSLICGIGAATLGAMTLGACADNYGGGEYASAGPMDVYYDGFYGPYPGGYWDGDVFLFRDHDGHFRRDEARHFRHDQFASARGFHAMRAPSAAQSGANAAATAPRAPAPAPEPAAPMPSGPVNPPH